jgi:hypothetical protein
MKVTLILICLRLLLLLLLLCTNFVLWVLSEYFFFKYFLTSSLQMKQNTILYIYIGNNKNGCLYPLYYNLSFKKMIIWGQQIIFILFKRSGFFSQDNWCLKFYLGFRISSTVVTYFFQHWFSWQIKEINFIAIFLS